MKITFLMPGYNWDPSGGFRVVYEYANRLVNRGHEVAIVQPLRLKYAPHTDWSTRDWLRSKAWELASLVYKPKVDWQTVDKRVELLYVRDSESRHIPDADAIFATGWATVRSVLELPQTKGKKCYMIQGYESYHAQKDLVDATWRAPLHKVVIAKWLVDVGKELGCSDVHYIPNAIDQGRYRLDRPIEGRPRQVSMVFSTVPVKGSVDGIEALGIVHEKYPDVKVVLFGLSPAQSWIPKWAEYHRNPPQDFIVEEIYNKSQIFVGSSWVEGFSLPPAEAAACGCAVVTTDSLGIREFIEQGVTGLVSPPKDPEALAKNISLLLDNEPLRVRLAKACHRVISQMNWERSVDQLVDFLQVVVQGKKSDFERIISSVEQES
jgi:glycosyltransferase involved in cell wall biosynthesis